MDISQDTPDRSTHPLFPLALSPCQLLQSLNPGLTVRSCPHRLSAIPPRTQPPQCCTLTLPLARLPVPPPVMVLQLLREAPQQPPVLILKTADTLRLEAAAAGGGGAE